MLLKGSVMCFYASNFLVTKEKKMKEYLLELHFVNLKSCFNDSWCQYTTSEQILKETIFWNI